MDLGLIYSFGPPWLISTSTFPGCSLHGRCSNRRPEKDTVLWNTVISGLVKNCCFEDSISVFTLYGDG